MKSKSINNKGITLASLTIYVVVATIVISILAFLNAQFFKNISELTNESRIVSEDLNFKAFLISDIKRNKDINVSEFNNRQFTLSNNIKYEIRALDDDLTQGKRYAVYRNDAQIAKGIVPFLDSEVTTGNVDPSFDYDTASNILKVNLKFSDGYNSYVDQTSFSVGQKHIDRPTTGFEDAVPVIIRYYITYLSNDGNDKSFTMTRQDGGTAYIAGNNFMGLDKSDYELLGWSTTENGPVEYTVGAEYTGEDITLYAVWERIRYRYDGQITFTGSNYLDTEVKLFSERNAHRNFLVQLTIDELADGNVNNNTMFACNNEKNSPFQGTGFRYLYAAATGAQYQVFANCRTMSEVKIPLEIDGRNSLKLLRLNDQLYYRFADSTDETAPFYPVLDYTGFNKYIDKHATFGASIDERDRYYRFFKGKLSNLSIRIDDTLKAEDFVFFDPNAPTDNLYEYFRKDGVSIFNGTSDHINTGLNLFDSTNREKDFEITFRVKSMVANSGQRTMVNTKLEQSSRDYPGFCLRFNATNTTSLNVTSKGGKNPYNPNITYNVTIPYSVKISRVDMKLFVEINGTSVSGSNPVTDYSDMAAFDNPLTFGCTIIGGNPDRFWQGELEDILVRIEGDD